ncbi:MAG: DNA polymerase III subunit gamma/tau [Planctomycetes bacterium]|nr:DNA polymerase III subunit gamma/tau [Planctomycetota bacterium]MBI3845071.1 DNA polymerase III subunit gamma/tau [Planctomycetota bacterium]
MSQPRPYLVLARKYRPATFDDVVGQTPIAVTLQRAVEEARVAHAYLFCGSRGIGKTSMARILAKALNCMNANAPTPTPCNTCDLCRAVTAGQDVDVIEIDGASNNGVEEVRQLRDSARYRPARARFKIYIIDEVHMLTTAAFNALLKTLEEPPPHVKFILATTQPEKLPDTILSRCQRFDFRRIPEKEIGSRLEEIATKEGLSLDPDAAFLVAKAARGSLRDALTLLDRIAAGASGGITRDCAEASLGFVPRVRLFDLVERLAEKDAAGAIAILDDVHRSGRDLDEFARAIVDHLRALLVARTCGADKLEDETGEDRRRLAEQALRFEAEALLAMLQIVIDAARRSKRSDLGRVHLEMAFVECARLADLVSVAELLARADAGIPREGAKAAPSRTPGSRSSTAPPASLRTAPEAPGRPAAEPTTTSSPDRVTDVPPRAEVVGEPTAAAPSPAPVPLTIERVRESWSGIVECVRSKKMSLAMLLHQSHPLEIVDGELRLGFRKELGTLARHLDNADSRSIVEECLRHVTGTRVRVVGTLIGPEVDVPLPSGSGEASGESASRVGRGSDVDSSPRDGSGAVKRALEIFEGRIVGRER